MIDPIVSQICQNQQFSTAITIFAALCAKSYHPAPQAHTPQLFQRSQALTLALFDLDNTLIAGDSDHLWGEFLVQNNLVDTTAYQRQNDQFYQDYKEGQLDIHAYLNFALAPLAQWDNNKLDQLHQQFMQSSIAPIMLPKAQALIESHRARGHTLVVITATNRFVTAPIVKTLGIEHLIASEAEIQNGRYTGRTTDTPCYKEGKVTRLNQWLEQNPAHSLEGSYFYSDSASDIPLLEQVTHPIAVDPDDRLARYAKAQHWEMMSLREALTPAT